MQDFRMETFLAVCRNLNYTKAAEELCITQPAVSQHIRHLEEYYGTRLFISEGKKMVLTEAGRLLQSAGLTMRHDECALKEQMARAGAEGRSLHMGATMTIGEFVLPFMLNSFMLNEPEATVHVTVANTTDLLRSIDEGKLDFALVEGYFSGGDYDYQIYSTEKYIPVAGAAYQLQASSRGKKLLRTEDLLSEPILIREQGSGTREVLERILEGKNLAVRDFRKIHEINNLQVMKYLIREGRGITFLYEAAVRQEIEQGILREIRLKDFSVEHDFYFVWRKGSIYGSEYKEIFKQLKGEEYDGKETRE